MRVAFIDNCRFVFSLGWNIFARFSAVVTGIDNIIGSRRRFSDVVMPMSVVAALISFLGVVVYTRNYQHAVARMIYVFGSILLLYVVFVSILNFFASRRWFTDSPDEFCRCAKSFVVCLLAVHFDATIVAAVVPSLRIAELLRFFVIFVSWNMAGSYLPVSRYRHAFGLLSGASFIFFDTLLRMVLAKVLPNMPL